MQRTAGTPTDGRERGAGPRGGRRARRLPRPAGGGGERSAGGRRGGDSRVPLRSIRWPGDSPVVSSVTYRLPPWAAVREPRGVVTPCRRILLSASLVRGG